LFNTFQKEWLEGVGPVDEGCCGETEMYFHGIEEMYSIAGEELVAFEVDGADLVFSLVAAGLVTGVGVMAMDDFVSELPHKLKL
jgi:hypothetical protein